MVSISEKLKDMINSELNTAMARHTKGGKQAQVIAVCSQKGGVGKTTTAVNLGYALSYFHKKKVLIIDLDPQGHIEKSMSAIIQEGVDYSPLSSILLAKRGDILDGIVKTKFDKLDITPGDKALYETEGVLSSKIGREFILTHALAMARTHYDVIVMDCPPNLGNLTINALCAATHVLIPCEMSVLAFEGVSDLLETVEMIGERLNPNLKVLGVLFTRVDRRNLTMNQLVEESMRKQFKGGIFKSRIMVNTDLNKAQLEGVPVQEFDGNCSGAANYKNLSDEMVKALKAMAE
jgi:chromosome partitioning protein